MRLLSVTTALVTAVLLISGCSGGGSDRADAPEDPPEQVARFCGLVTEWADLDRRYDNLELADYNEQIRVMRRSLDLFAEVPANAPPSIGPDMQTIVRTPINPVRISDAEARTAAVQVVDRYIGERCDVRLSMADRDFTRQ